MLNTDLEIKEIQFKRGKKSVLEEKLVADILGVPKAGEPIYETDTGKLKLGDGETAYKDLSYFGDADVPNFIIQDPLSNQVLLYDESLQAWVNKDLADKESIIYLAERGLTIKGYDDAGQGYMLVKDQTEGLAWIKPITDTQLQQSVTAATAAKDQAGVYSTQAGNSAVEADTAAKTAQIINNQTMTYVNDKFWWGSIEEYNALESINPGTFYFITAKSH
jgi:hypothetical protein